MSKRKELLLQKPCAVPSSAFLLVGRSTICGARVNGMWNVSLIHFKCLNSLSHTQLEVANNHQNKSLLLKKTLWLLSGFWGREETHFHRTLFHAHISNLYSFINLKSSVHLSKMRKIFLVESYSARPVISMVKKLGC